MQQQIQHSSETIIKSQEQQTGDKSELHQLQQASESKAELQEQQTKDKSELHQTEEQLQQDNEAIAELQAEKYHFAVAAENKVDSKPFSEFSERLETLTHSSSCK